ncbi:putative bifunctional diguanylate cyclase/phosphodiesterase [Mumia flava]|uniref:putative bifunctional diguanylate cyclase/phosphodiesterase n=1 Tax=Mumia flava TaxID=1348852 RepID=UPI000C247980|nr:bifunctional diguanylate cyclase/phosphodiesterase [Mumia flava]
MPNEGWEQAWWWWAAVPVVALASAAPLYLGRDQVVGAEASVLLFLSLTLPWPQALVVWTVGVVAARLLVNPQGRRVHDVALAVVCGAVAVGVVAVLDTSRTFGVQEVVAVVLAFSAYFALGVAVVGLGEGGGAVVGSARRRVWEVGTLYGVFFGVAAMGYVCVLLYRAVSGWALLAVAPALVIVLVAVNGVTRQRETARRLDVLFRTARALHSAASEDQILEIIDAGVRRLGDPTESGLWTTMPQGDEVRRLFITGDQVCWLVVAPMPGTPDATLSLAEAIASIAQQAEEALSRMRMNRDLEEAAEHDPLTGLVNRAVFLDTLAATEGRRAVLFCDLDGFKKVNDRFGHPSGDAALVRIARRLSDGLPDDVCVARLGGDEFAILVTGDDAQARSVVVAEQVRELVARPIRAEQATLAISVSIGIAYDAGPDHVDDLLRNADIAMYEGKRTGRDRTVVYEPAMGTQRLRSLELAERLAAAISDKRLRVVYQPIVSASTGGLLAVEALARWTEDGEVVSPEEFIPLAESADLIEQLGELVLDLVRADVPQLSRALPDGTTIAVNMSARQLGTPRFLDAVERTRVRLAPFSLTLEVTETEVISEDTLASGVLDTLRAGGIEVAVDDFGIGFSSMERLMRLPVDTLKLDRIFSAEVDADRRRAEFLASMLQMAAALRLRTVVEGIERRSQVEVIESLVSAQEFEALAMQGYLFGGPMSPSTLVRWAAEQRRRSAH